MNDDKMVIDRDVFVVASFFLAINELKEEGFLEGGPDIDKKGLLAIVKLGRSMGFDEPSKDEIMSITHRMCEGGKRENRKRGRYGKSRHQKEKKEGSKNEMY